MPSTKRTVIVPSHTASHHSDTCLPKHGALICPSTRFGGVPLHSHNARKPQKDSHNVHNHHDQRGNSPTLQPRRHSSYTPIVSSASLFYTKVIARQSAKFALQAATRAETRSRPSFKSLPVSSQPGSLVSKIIASLLGLLSSIVQVCLRLVWSTPIGDESTWPLSVAATSKVNLGSQGKKVKAPDSPRISDFMRLSVPVTWYAQPAFRKCILVRS